MQFACYWLGDSDVHVFVKHVIIGHRSCTHLRVQSQEPINSTNDIA